MGVRKSLAGLVLLFAGAALSASAGSSNLPPPDNRKLARDIFAEIVTIRSVHDIGTREVANALAKHFRAAGFARNDVHVIADPKFPHQMNLIVRLRGKGKGKPILWYGHMDVVEAKAEDWSLPPFELTEKGGYFYGRGTSDMKDQVAAVAAALIRLKKENFVPERDIIVAFTADEEVGEEQDGLWYLLREHRSLIDAEMLINPDGSSGSLVNGKRREFGVQTSEKTYATFALEVTNRGGHSSEPRPDNAIYSLARGLARLEKFPFPYKTNATTRLYFARSAGLETGQTRADMLAVSKEKLDLAAARRLARDPARNSILHSTCVATMLAAGHQENALPQRARATVQCRIMPDETVEGTKAALEKAVADPAIKVTPTSLVTKAPESPPDAELLARVEKVVRSMWGNVPVIPVMSAGASDSIFARNAGMPSYGVSGAWEDIHDGRAHGRDERRGVTSFYESVEFTYRLMKELTGATE
ncbi:MAG: M20/M25/M40 family metallo-hydrolase [Alphaproteobacteria bacterium]